MDPKYEPLLRQIDSLKYNIQDAVDHPEDSQARALQQEIQDYISDIRTNKRPRDLENRLKNMQVCLRRAHAHPGSFMSVEHADYFHHILEDIRMRIRQLPNY
jgi:hypothetical protein